MKVALIGASGKIGTQILAELRRRSHSVTAVARHPEKIAAADGVRAVEGDIGNPTALAATLRGHDAIISSVRFRSFRPAALIGAVKTSGVRRLIVVGGAGTLEVRPGVMLLDTPEFPAASREEATAGRAAFEALKAERELDWTFLSPSAIIAPGERTGTFRLGKDQLLIGADGKSRISISDFAIALVDELELPRNVRQRFTVGY